MNQYFTFAFENIINIAEVSLFFYFITRKLEIKKKHNAMLVIAPWILGLVIVINILKSLNISPIISMFSFLIFQIIFAFSHMEGTRAEKIVWACTFEILDVAADGMVFFTSSAIAELTMNELMYDYPQRYAVISAYILILAGLVLVFTKIKKQKFILPKRILIPFLSITAIITITIEVMTALGVALPNEHDMQIFYILYLAITVFLIFSISIILITIFTGNTLYKNRILSEKTNKMEDEITKYKNNSKANYFEIKQNGHIQKLNISEVRHFTSKGRIITAHMESGEKIKFYEKMDDLFKKIEDIQITMARINKSCTVNFMHLQKWSNRSIILEGDEIRVTPKYLGEFQRKIKSM